MPLGRRDFMKITGVVAVGGGVMTPLGKMLSQQELTMENKIVYTAAGTGEAYWVMSDLFTYLVTGEESDGNYFTLEINVAPNGGPPPHIHHLEDEQFYIVDGNLTFQVGDQTFQASTGDFIHIPREKVHSFKNGSQPAKLLATFSPAGIEGFFREVGTLVEDRAAPPPPVTEATIGRFVQAEANGWKEHHDTLPPPDQSGD